MKKSILMCLALAMAASLAGASDVTKSLCSFWTKGPDRYADGSVVADGESYYLVFVPSGITGWAIDNKGALTGGAELKLVLSAQGGCCPKFNYQFTPVKMGSGTLQLVLLDTRGGADGVPSLTNGVSAVSMPASAVSTSNSSVSLAGVDNGLGAFLVTDGAIGLSAGTAFVAPAILSIQSGADGVSITASASDVGQYTVYQSTDMVNWEPVSGATGVRAAAFARKLSVASAAAGEKVFFQIRSNVSK